MPLFEEARAIILNHVSTVGIERLSILEAVGRILAEDVTAPWDLPRVTNSAMDGYALRAMDCAQQATLPIEGFIPAGGSLGTSLKPGTAAKIMTGAPMPEGADTVVPVEDVTETEDGVCFPAGVKAGAHVRLRGEDVQAGECVISRGTLLRPAEIGMLASFGKIFVSVYRPPRVAILATGDELVEPGECLAEDRIINSNTLTLAAAIKELGAQPTLLGIARDTPECTREKVLEGLKADVLITSAGVSAGDRDFVRSVLEELGAETLFCRVDIKPGRPTTFALHGQTPVFCLPGNPVSTMVTFEELARPALLKMMGHHRVIKPLIEATLLTDLTKKRLGVLNFQRVSIEVRDGRYLARCSGDQNTGILKTMVQADALALLPEDLDSFKAGDKVYIHLLGGNVDMIPC